MKVVNVEPVKKHINDFRNGDNFVYKGSLYLKIEGPWEHFDFNVLNMVNGRFEKIHPSEELIPAKAIATVSIDYEEI